MSFMGERVSCLIRCIIGQVLPGSVVVDVEEAEVTPESEPDDRVIDEGTGQFISGSGEGFLRANEIEGVAFADFLEEFLFPNSTFTEFHPDSADLVVPLGLLEISPAVLNLQADHIGRVFEIAFGSFQIDERGAKAITLRFAVEG